MSMWRRVNESAHPTVFLLHQRALATTRVPVASANATGLEINMSKTSTRKHPGAWHRLNRRAYHIPLHGQCVHCARCRHETVWAASATSDTLRSWRVVTFPRECYCPTCAGGRLA